MEGTHRKDNESEAEYFQRVILILQANTEELVLQNTENEEKLKREAAENEKRLKREAAELLRESARQTSIAENKFSLMKLIGQVSNDAGIFEIIVPRSIALHPDRVGEAAEIVGNFNSMSETIEKSGSIGAHNSVHFLWSKLIRIVQKSIIPQNVGRRVVYEWGCADCRVKAIYFS